MAQSPERWASKILSLPVFDDVFAKAVQGSPFANLAFVAAMEVGSAHEFVEKVVEWAPKLDEAIRDDLVRSTFMLEQFGRWPVQWNGRSLNLRPTSSVLGCVRPRLQLARPRPELVGLTQSKLSLGSRSIHQGSF